MPARPSSSPSGRAAGSGRDGTVYPVEERVGEEFLQRLIVELSDIDGRSLVPFLKGKSPEGWRDDVFFEHDFRDVRGQAVERALGISSDECCYAVIRGRKWKYVHFAALPPLLFDLEADPHELHNLAGDPAMRDVLLDCAQRMLDWRLTSQERTLTNMSIGTGGVFVRA